MIEKIIHFCVGSKPSDYQKEIFEIARALHPGWEIMIWQDPVSSEDFLLSSYHEKANSGAQLADLIRLDVVYKYGGIYLDSDVRLRKGLHPLLQHDNFFCSEDGSALTNAVFGATKHNPLVKTLINHLLDNEPDWKEPPNEATGPVFFARVLRWEAGLTILPRESFYPFNYDEEPFESSRIIYGVHEWSGSWLSDEIKTKIHADKIKSSKRSFFRTRAKSVVKRIIRKTVAIANPDGPSFSRSSYSFGRDLIALTNRGIQMSLPGSDLSITPSIALSGSYEETETRFVEKTLRGGDLFVDVGCNVGPFTLVAAQRVGPFGRVVGFDPNPTVLLHLRRSLVMNWFHDRVRLLNCAVGDEKTSVTLRYSELRLGDGNIGLDSGSVFHRSVENLGGMEEVQVDMIRLDEIFSYPVEIKILKIDVEGFEYSVLAGAQSLLQEKCIDFLMLELLEEVAATRHRRNVEAVQRLIEHGYSVGRLDGEGNWLLCDSIDAAMRYSKNIVLHRD